MNKPDRLYELMPVVYRQVDADKGLVLQALLRQIAKQVNIVEADIDRLYENWFIETCDDWVVPYIGELVGYRPVHEAGEPGDPRKAAAQVLNKILIPRREVANTIGYRRRKGTLALLELLANNVAGWPARAVEFYKLLGWTQHLKHPRLDLGELANLREGAELDLLQGPFTANRHSVDVRRINSPRGKGFFNIPSVAVFVWRLKTYSVSKTSAYCVEEEGPECYLFNALGHDTQLFNCPQPETSPTHIADQLNLPVPIARRAFEERISEPGGGERKQASAKYYNASLSISLQDKKNNWTEIPRESVIPANLSDWQKYRPARGIVAVDPELGRIVFPSNQKPRYGVEVSYRYAFSADIGGGEYERRLSQPDKAKVYKVGRDQEFKTIRDALLFIKDQPQAVIEIQDSGVYSEQLSVELNEGQYLQIRAAQSKRPIIRLLDYQASLPDALRVQGKKLSRLTMDGLLIVGRGLQVNGPEEVSIDMSDLLSTLENDLCDVTIRHCTLVPGWTLHSNCEPQRPNDQSLEFEYTRAAIRIEHSIVGSITTEARERATEPQKIRITDSILDATSEDRIALGSSRGGIAYVVLSVARSTIIGSVQTHAIDLAENSIFNGIVTVARRGQGCVRFCYVPPDSRTPRRFECQPDLAKQAVIEDPNIAAVDKVNLAQQETDRVRPRFNSLRFGAPTYCQLSDYCPEEITRGADDESEIGVFHDLYQPQRAANLRARLDEYTPAGMDAGIVYAN